VNDPPGAIRSRNGRFLVQGFCGHCSAPYVWDTKTNKRIGVYVDDTTPNRRHWCEVALAHHPVPESVFVGIAPGESRQDLQDKTLGIPDVPPPALIRLWEFLPWGMGHPWRAFLPVPPCGKGNGYILQMRWPGFYGKRPPSTTCKDTQLEQARAFKPRFTFTV
jgi:hypothetical protein